MKHKQGGTRSLPDGFLHIQNFTVTKAAGVEAVVWKLMSKEQKDLVELVLIERSLQCDAFKYLGVEVKNFKHDTWRFKKTFLENNFRSAVRHVLLACNVCPQELFKSHWFR